MITTKRNAKPPRAQQNALHALTGLGVCAAFIWVTLQVFHSSLFNLKSINVEPLSAHYPLNVEQTLNLAHVSLGGRSLFELDLGPIETRLMKHPWVKGVILGKQFPNTLTLKVIERNPIALLTESN